MEFIVFVVLTVLLIVSIAAWQQASNRARKSEESLKQVIESTAAQIANADAQATSLENLTAQLDAANATIKELESYRAVEDAAQKATRILSQAQGILDNATKQAIQLVAGVENTTIKIRDDAGGVLEQAKTQAKAEIDQAHAAAAQRLSDAQQEIAGAQDQAQVIIQKARQEAEQIAGDARVAKQKVDALQKTLQAMEGTIKGYGDACIVPTHSLLDDLADEFSHTDAGSNLRQARTHTRDMVLNQGAATCDDAEAHRREAAISFVTDAFNGKVDSILGRVKSDNVGKLEQEIRGAFQLVNHNGAAFCNARVTDAYLAARLDELHWTATAKALQEHAREEQRRLREQIREEERARKEFERAMKEAQKEEAALHKAMDKVQAQLQKANAEQKAALEAQLAELIEKLRLAREKGLRAHSMAQQTRAGHVYVISNIGSFGENVYKIGMTRRLEPLDLVRELGDASVPFEFDVHAMIYSDDAPKLEKSLHRHFMRAQVNKVSPRKEFFRVGIREIMEHVESTGIQAHWTLAAKVASLRETQRIEQLLLAGGAEGQRWMEIQTEAIETDERQEETETA